MTKYVRWQWIGLLSDAECRRLLRIILDPIDNGHCEYGGEMISQIERLISEEYQKISDRLAAATNEEIPLTLPRLKHGGF